MDATILMLNVYGCVSMALCSVGTVLIIVAVAKFEDLQNPTNVFIINLSLADFCIGEYTRYCNIFFFINSKLF